MKKNSLGKLWILSLISGLLLAVPYIYPHCGLVSLVAFLPLLAAERIATENGIRHFGLFRITQDSFFGTSLQPGGYGMPLRQERLRP